MKFPKKLFVKIEGREGEEHFDPHHSVDTMVDAGEKVRVAVYVLKEIVEAEGSVTIVNTKPIRKRAA